VLLAHQYGGIEDPKNASSYPKSIRTCAKAAAILSRAVELAKEYSGACNYTQEVAACVEMLRAFNSRLGTERVLPHKGTAEERVALFTEAIEKLRRNSPGEKPLDPEAVVTVCARACGNRQELFGAVRKKESRKARREK
jgi:hypothetical protein